MPLYGFRWLFGYLSRPDQSSQLPILLVSIQWQMHFLHFSLVLSSIIIGKNPLCSPQVRCHFSSTDSQVLPISRKIPQYFTIPVLRYSGSLSYSLCSEAWWEICEILLSLRLWPSFLKKKREIKRMEWLGQWTEYLLLLLRWQAVLS